MPHKANEARRHKVPGAPGNVVSRIANLTSADPSLADSSKATTFMLRFERTFPAARPRRPRHERPGLRPRASDDGADESGRG